MPQNRLRTLYRTTLLGIGLALSQFAAAGIYDDPQNLKSLPKDIDAKQLSAIMKKFSFATGLRCSSCHVGEEGQPLETYDFASDEKIQKQTARDMLKMVKTINDKLLAKLDESQREGVGVSCMTCHRGQNRPRMIEDVLTDTFREDGLAAALDKYRELRKQYYGSHTYDFSEMTLNEFAGDVAKSGQHDAALALIDLNLENFPDSYMSHFYKGRVYFAKGDKAGA
ncbi:MAG: c-type cytochrome, partial [Gammaproteobacteria bacterium]|nr:c-type cytochrome [Gammaproteobacteria bacterium]